MGFDAGQAVEPLDYDFGDYGPKGTIPEPTHEQVENLFKAIRGVVVAAGLEPGASPEEVLRAFGALPDEVQKRQTEATFDALAEFCRGTPTREQIEGLPYRLLNAFLGWLVGQFAGDGGVA